MYKDETKQRAMEIVSNLDELIRQLTDSHAPTATIESLKAAIIAIESTEGLTD